MEQRRVCNRHAQENYLLGLAEKANDVKKSVGSEWKDLMPKGVADQKKKRKLYSMSFDWGDCANVENKPLTGMTSTPLKLDDKNNVRNDNKKKQTPFEALDEFTRLLAKSDFEAGNRYAISKKYDSAIKSWKSAERLKHPRATFNLGLCYEKGLGTEKNDTMACFYYKRATHFGHKGAMHNLGVFYANGYGGLPKNRKMALKLWRKAKIAIIADS